MYYNVLCNRLVQRTEASHEVCYPAYLARADGPHKQLLLLHSNPKNRRTGKNDRQIVNPDILSSIARVPHSTDLPGSTPPRRRRPSSGDSSKSDSEADTGDMDYDSQMNLGIESRTSLTRKT